MGYPEISPELMKKQAGVPAKRAKCAGFDADGKGSGLRLSGFLGVGSQLLAEEGAED